MAGFLRHKQVHVSIYAVMSNFMLIMAPCVMLSSCSNDPEAVPGNPVDTTKQDEKPFDINSINDTYSEIAALDNWWRWGPYNTHDPSIIRHGEYFYSFSTDAAYGITVPPGIQVRRSKDLIDWKFVKWAISALPAAGANFIRSYGGTPFQSLWAPFIMKAGNEFRLYYSLSSPTPRLSVIGLLTSSHPEGPWTERGLVVTSLNDNSIQTNAIDPSVIVDKNGRHWMYYGSAWDGIYLLQLNPQTGLAQQPSDKGRRIAQRGFTGNSINGNIEAPEIIYHPQLDKYYLFIAYDWLETKYNVRVGRGDSPEGPFYDFHGRDMNTESDDAPMILAPYKFKDHGGWQGTSHVSVFNDNGQFYMAHQGRPGVNKYFMVMHVRKIFWTEDGWPVVSPQRYAGTEQTPVTQAELEGTWEHITFNYRIVPGYAEQQTSADFQVSKDLVLNSGGSMRDGAGTWSYDAPWLELKWSDGITARVMVERGRDWENKRSALLFTGLTGDGIAMWGKK